MQDMTSAEAYYQEAMMMTAKQPEQEQLKCPRCDSPNTKFCYYNNYNLSQPRHFCKNCRRYWTKGGSLRNIPVGGGSRKNSKRSPSSSSSTNLRNKPVAASDQKQQQAEEEGIKGNSGQEIDPTRMLYGLPVGGSFSSLLASNMREIDYESGSRWFPGTGLGSGFRRSDDAWTHE